MTWRCVECAEQHEDTFDTCWNCGHSRDGEFGGPFTRATDPPERARFVDAIVEHAAELGKGTLTPTEKLAKMLRTYEQRLRALESEVASLRSELRRSAPTSSRAPGCAPKHST